ncbi:MAG: LysM peptidoglycan-binding domain-containing protein [Flavobacteriales bacterium]|jgi:membrane-bound lytic murein transglycosylase D|nr:LysM peptidoglycan-binding domain-containing protein [Flavobacteriales bacterium]MBP9159351.1 LysM peptidoglycan-binding domain-containing protein [Flavobacteriales bacterium]MCI1751878.1 LysM peptidoglycan-binding domain-containing protein [Flavobacteriales bacterium]
MRTTHLFLALFSAGALLAQDAVPADDPILENLDKLSILPWLKNDPFSTDVSALNVHHFAPGDMPTYSPEVYQQRLLELDEKSPFKLTYNDPVQSYINLYANNRREQTQRMLGLKELYFPIFEQALDRYGLPQELKYLAVVESALYPGARSRAAAVGLWQFMIGTGKMYGLRVDSYVDERCDIYKSTDAACRYLKDLYGIFGDWELALAAYNCGPGNVNKAIRRSGGKLDYWSIYTNLPRETRGYVPAFIAVNYIFNHAADHNMYPVIPNYCAYEVDTIQVRYPLQLEQLASITGSNAQELLDLNPMFKSGYVPKMDGPATVYVPRTLVAEIIEQEDTIARSYQPDRSNPAPATVTAVASKSTSSGKSKTHVVRRGESLGLIAQRNGVSVRDLRNWNGLRSDRIHAGQRLVIKRNAEPEAVTAQAEKAETVKADTKADDSSNEIEYIYHTIQPGDTLWGIAKNYPGVSVDDIKRLNGDLNTRHLSVGKKLKVGVSKG